MYHLVQNYSLRMLITLEMAYEIEAFIAYYPISTITTSLRVGTTLGMEEI